MKRFVSCLALSFGVMVPVVAQSHAGQPPVAEVDPDDATGPVPIAGIWQGVATLRGAKIPITLKITIHGSNLKVAFLNGPADQPVESAASSVKFNGTHLVASYDYFARKIDATLAGDKLTGTYGSVSANSKAAPIPFTVTRSGKLADPTPVLGAPDIRGSWWVATSSSKGEAAWEFRVDPPIGSSPVIKTVIQRIDGDTGGLWGVWNGTSYIVGHFNAASAALYSVTPQAGGVLVLKNLIPPAPSAKTGADEHAASVSAPVVAPSEYIAHRAEEAKKEKLAAPTDPTQQTSVRDPNVPFAFSFPDLAGKTVANTDPRFAGKVVIVAIGGSWCPNCHDEAPFLVNLYKKFHDKGLEIVSLDFEQGDPDTDTLRLKAFIAHYGIPYPVLVAGNTDQLEEKIPQGVNLNCWPTSFFLGRDGRVKEVHAGFAGPGNTAGHVELERDETGLIEKLLAEPAPKQVGSR